ncbi:MAG: hypothetical protein Q6K35_10700, partial [Thermostichus sp. DG02_4_bins_136]
MSAFARVVGVAALEPSPVPVGLTKMVFGPEGVGVGVGVGVAVGVGVGVENTIGVEPLHDTNSIDSKAGKVTARGRDLVARITITQAR